MKRLLALLFAFTLIPAAAAPAKYHMIAAANPYAAEAGLQMLRQGGSAVDAAIAAQMVLTLVEPESSGIGGGAFMLVFDPKTGKATSFDGRETAPASATPGMFLDAAGNPRAHRDAIPGGLSVGVPGAVAMLELAHKKYGKLPWATLFEPAIKLAEDGRIYINAGADAGLEPGLVLQAEALGEALKDPITGEILDAETRSAGSITLSEVRERISIGTLTPSIPPVPLRPGDRVAVAILH